MKGYKPGSPYLKYYEYIKEHGYSRHLYEFKDEYANMPVDVQKDEEKGLYYVQKEKKRLYFRKSTPAKKIQKYYRASSIISNDEYPSAQPTSTNTFPRRVLFRSNICQKIL